MNRVTILLSLLCLAACSRTESAPALPRSVAPGWRLESLSKSETPGWWKAEYRGPGTVHLQVYGLPSSASGLDMVQKRRPAAETVTFYTDRYFAVVQWERTDRAALQPLMKAVQESLK